MGSPRYVKGIDPTSQPRRLATLAPSSSLILIGIRDDLLKLTRKTVDAAKVVSMSLKAISWSSIAGKIISVSSAYCTIG